MLVSWRIISFPGYYAQNGSMKEHDIWYNTTDSSLYFWSSTLWTFLFITSTIISVCAIRKIFSITRSLSKTNSNVKVDQKSMLIHASLLVVQIFVCLAELIPYNWAPRFASKTYIIFPLFNMIVQLVICYICWT